MPHRIINCHEFMEVSRLIIIIYIYIYIILYIILFMINKLFIILLDLF